MTLYINTQRILLESCCRPMPCSWNYAILCISQKASSIISCSLHFQTMKAIWKVRGLVAECHCYAEGGSDCNAKL